MQPGRKTRNILPWEEGTINFGKESRLRFYILSGASGFDQQTC
jgi:hypothetical protein